MDRGSLLRTACGRMFESGSNASGPSIIHSTEMRVNKSGVPPALNRPTLRGSRRFVSRAP